MPELPEVETVRRGLEAALVGASFARVEQRRPDLRFPFPERFAARLENRTVTSLGRRAKYLVADLSSGEVLVMHLGMSGRFLVRKEGRSSMPGEFHREHGGESAHDHVVFHVSNGATITYNDARRFGFMDLVPRSELETCRHFAGMGIEPLGHELSGTAIARLFRDRRTPLKAALLDQRVVAGVGNIYASEALHVAGLSPLRRAGMLATPTGAARDSAHRLAAAIKQVLNDAIARAAGRRYRSSRFRVYDREGQPCRRGGCEGVVRRRTQAGRSTFYCPVCQR